MSDALTFYALNVGACFETRPSNGFVFCKVDDRIYEAYNGMELYELETREDFDVTLLAEEKFDDWAAVLYCAVPGGE